MGLMLHTNAKQLIKKQNYKDELEVLIMGENGDNGYRKTKFWKAEKDFCYWDGVSCNMETGHAESLDLNHSWLHGPLHSNSSRFNFHQLQQLNLAFNNFSFSAIPSELGLLSRVDMIKGLVKNMTNIREIVIDYVNLSSSLPESLTNLSSLESLLLGGCRLHDTNLSATLPDSIENLKSLNVLDIGYCDFSGTLPFSLWNLSQLTELYLSGNNFSSINQLLPSVGKLSKLTILKLAALQLSGELAFSLGNLSRLEILDLSKNNFSGQIPSSFGNLKKLQSLNLMYSGVSGNIPSSLGDLIRLEDLILQGNNLNSQIPLILGNLTNLDHLDLSENNLSGQIPDSLGNLTKLENLYLFRNNLSGQIPPSLVNLTRLENLYLSENNLSGQIPSSLGNLIGLTSLEILYNNFSGKFPWSDGNLSQLIFLDISSNCFEGVIPWSLFTISSLEVMFMDDNQFSGPFNIQNVGSSQLWVLGISGNKLTGKIPKSISKLQNLEELYLGSNYMSGTFELGYLLELNLLYKLDLQCNNISKLSNAHNLTSFVHNLEYFNLSSCNISEFLEILKSLPRLDVLDLSHNRIEGPIPKWFLSVGIDTLNLQGPVVVPPDSIAYYIVSNNNLTGGIQPLFCKLKNLQFLDVSNNLLNGTIPHFLGRLCTRASSSHFNFTTLDLSNNRLQGKVPHSLSKCKQLEILNLGHNEIKDTFPSWLAKLSKLQVLVLRSNKFFGPLWNLHDNIFGFGMLQIFDLSFNGFNGTLPPDYFRTWSSMIQISNQDKSSTVTYMGDEEDRYTYYASVKDLLIYAFDDDRVIIVGLIYY
ncbi:receptor-like protein 53 [Ziziphus jujuba]|uniref:Receptor-like protein 53 n=1 Tax=Ziziphus jujuba TaxID=326968 RepID=A0ABM3ZWM1_ZIZJJ|nr:receptor-like protein 53 [Ziziphus jujuba]